jgi:Phosphotransferase enzyme family
LQGHAPHSPCFYGGDRETGFILLEDLGMHASLVEPLLNGEEADAVQALLSYAARLGTLHADTIGQEARFTQLWQTLTPPVGSVTREATRLAVQIVQLQQHVERLGARVPPAFGEEVATTFIAPHTPGPFWAYLHGDPCPDNVVYTGAEVRLIDFECGRFGHALCDGSYGRMLFPTCWCANRLPETVVAQMERVYRTALVPGCAAAADERLFADALVDACGYWMLRTLVRHLPQALDEDRPWGIATIRPRLVSHLEAFITTAEAYHRLPAMRGTAHRVLEALRRRWPATPPLALYPAFRQDAPRQRETTEPG